MKILALESSAKAASCAVLADGELLASAWQAAGLTHSRTLLPMVEGMLKNSELTMEAMDAVAVAAGPGSFTGLRIGIAAVKGLAWAAEKPCIPVSTLEAMAWPLAHLEGSIVCAMDARRQQIYNAVFLADGGALERLREDRALSLEEAAADLAGLDGPMTIVGDGAQMCFDFFTARGIDCRLAPVHLRLQSAAGVALAAWRRRTETVSAQELTPVYLRLSQAERERLARGEST
ncbi:MAG: tRNA (adenosine(37)-N6)-threonylcarbamoyltransferase complex dimerization subunit type 1 TsaB [Oscillospiraceae bacterium]|jgi:tRNA threonylcarbamoyladenosine biosynthesis protein TsaB|nr:tRNA (adenosine(37)-N6)-threonylcarbamoyltransferase complex dimerization subunit type 1 TsaB [Oscillospiraceae bacterium]